MRFSAKNLRAVPTDLEPAVPVDIELRVICRLGNSTVGAVVGNLKNNYVPFAKTRSSELK